ncbi:MAG: hypothetical protein IKO41_18465 [Lachnospiraceae bacterium]|nr:hypothetical protein [Lachnospiraceae bacterium]
MSEESTKEKSVGYEDILKFKNEIENIKNNCNVIQEKIIEKSQQSEELYKSLQENEENVKNKINDLNNNINALKKRYEEFNVKLVNYENNIKNVYANIIEFKSDKNLAPEEGFVSILSEIEKSYNEIKEYYLKLFGKTTKEKEVISQNVYNTLTDDERAFANGRYYKIVETRGGGIKDNIDKLISEIKESIDNEKNIANVIREKNEENYNELFNKIESLLPGATVAGLSEAYAKAWKTAEKTIIIWSITFTISLFLILLLSIFLIKFSIIDFSSVDSITKIFVQVMKMLGIEFPLIWFATTSNKKVIQYTRLTEEYKHKWSVMRIFNGMKKEIDNETSEENRKSLMNTFYSKVLDLLSLNPSNNFDKKVLSDFPAEKLLDKINNKKEENQNKL